MNNSRQTELPTIIRNMTTNETALQNRCLICEYRFQRSGSKICDSCELYVSQDHVAQREVPLPDEVLQSLRTRLEDTLDAPSGDDSASSFLRWLQLGGLSPRQLQVFCLRFIEDLSFQAIARRMRISKTMVLKQYRRGIRKILQRLPNLRLVGGYGSVSPKLPSSNEGRVSRAQSVPLSQVSPIRILRPGEEGQLRFVATVSPEMISANGVGAPPLRARGNPPSHFTYCPRCRAKLFGIAQGDPYCADCQWVPDLGDPTTVRSVA